ncbi:NADH-quinone oxidoreductase subunit C [Paenibacillus guangzhouensis]|uniref:NADH-quinone oxidoreductase subunit C n=1 Tax=Paenibacillus guangzhouensis TaxID=1473112 RepID=UPI001D112DBC|nr:NADH-quinone oxidoreductase subunit C [Paenibacillus guangzhouensis]
MSDEQDVKPDKPERKIMTPEEREAKIKAAAEAREARERAKAEAAGEAPAKAETDTTEAPAAEASTDGTAAAKPERKIMTPEEREAKIQAAAEARAARERAKADAGGGDAPAAEGAAEAKPERKVLTDEEKEAKAKAAAEARAARAKAKEEAEAAEAAPKEPSYNQPRLDRAIAILKEKIAEDVVEESSINENNNHLPTLTLKNEHWYKSAELLKHDPEFQCDYLRNVSGTDHETHMEVVYHMVSIATQHEYCIRVKTDRDQPSVDSVTPIWQTANWNEREIYDLLGIAFPGHPDLRRIMMSDDWVGHPLRKDYVPLDSEV